MPCLQCQAGQIEPAGGANAEGSNQECRHKIRGGQLNEFEYTENQGALADQKSKSQAKLIPGTPPEERGSQGTKKATKTSAKKRATKTAKATKSTKSTKTVATRGASAKKLAARKAAKKK